MRTAEGLLEVELGNAEPKTMPWDDDANFSYRQVMTRVIPQFPEAARSGIFGRAALEGFARSRHEDMVTYAAFAEYVLGKLADVGAMKGSPPSVVEAGPPQVSVRR
jgi:hypothetical protein